MELQRPPLVQLLLCCCYCCVHTPQVALSAIQQPQQLKAPLLAGLPKRGISVKQGCGPGDAVATLTSAGMGGKCADLNGLFVALSRASGVPARDVYGVRVAPSAFGFSQLGAKDAVITGAQHCRAEVWIAGRGWVRVDPTGAVAPSRVGQFQRLSAPPGAFASAVGNFVDTGTLQKLRSVWEAVNNRWNQWVINYTQSRQLNLLQSLGFESPSWTDLMRLLAGSLSALALLWLIWARATRPQRDDWSQLMHAARLRLQRAGVASGASDSTRSLSRRVQESWAKESASAPLAAAISDWLLDMERLRYAAGHDARTELPALRRRLAAVRRSAISARCSARVRPLRFVLRSKDQPSQPSSVAARTVCAFSGLQAATACSASCLGRPSLAARRTASSRMLSPSSAA